MSKYAQYSHGPMLGFIAAWANWISLVTLGANGGSCRCSIHEFLAMEVANWTHHFMQDGNITTPGLLLVFCVHDYFYFN